MCQPMLVDSSSLGNISKEEERKKTELLLDFFKPRNCTFSYEEHARMRNDLKEINALNYLSSVARDK